jgi:carbonic anhydrase
MIIINKVFLILIVIFTVNIIKITAQDKAVTQTKESQSAMTPDSALQILKEGNWRFVGGKTLSRDLSDQVKATAKAQYPYAVILSCIDSRVPPEIIFDQGIGDFFSIRLAGNVVNEDVLASMEFACKITGAKLILVLGHTDCGAIKGAIDDAKMDNLTSLLAKIKPAVEKTQTDGERNSKNNNFVEDVSKQNVLDAMKIIRDKSAVLDEMVKNGEIEIKGAMYDLETGKVEFY